MMGPIIDINGNTNAEKQPTPIEMEFIERITSFFCFSSRIYLSLIVIMLHKNNPVSAPGIILNLRVLKKITRATCL